MPATAAMFHPRDFFTLAPEISLAVWGLVVLLADVIWLRRRPAEARKDIVGRIALVGSIFSLGVAVVPLLVRFDLYGLQGPLNFAGIDYLSDPDPYLFFGTVSSDLMSETFNLLLAALLVLVVWMSTAWSFTEEWGEYFALILWSTVGMMLLTASEELLTLFLTLETMTICLYLATAFEKTKRRSAEGGLKYFVYGSVSSALFLFGLSLVYGLTGSTQFYAIREALLPSAGGYSAGLSGNVAGATAVLLLLVGFGFKVAAVPFHQWAPDAYEGAPAPVTAWVATGSKVASFAALMKVLLHALGPWESDQRGVLTPGWIGVVAVLAAASMTYGNFAALAQRNLKRMLAYSSIAHAGYTLVGVAATGVTTRFESGGAVLFYLVAYAFANVGAFALAAWLARDKGTDEIADLDGMGYQYPGLATCVLLLMLSLIGLPPLAGFFGKLYMFMEALDQSPTRGGRLTLVWLVALGLLNSVVSAFYYVRVLKAMFLRPPDPSRPPLAAPPSSVAAAIVLGTAVTLALGVAPGPVINLMQAAAVPMLSETGRIGFDGVNVQTPPGPPLPPTPQEVEARTSKNRIFPGAGATGGPPPSMSPTPPPPPAPEEKAKQKAKGKDAGPAPKGEVGASKK
jgi:NADH-quinone oxidoreductase subunit N